MITIRELDYDTSEKPEQLFSRLTWAVERVDGLFGQLINGVTVNTNRPWVGVYDESELKFGLVEPSGYFLNRKIFQIVVRGKITDDGEKTIVNIKLRLGWNTLFLFGLLYLGACFMIAFTAVLGELNDLWGVLLWILIFPGLGTFLLRKKLDKVERQVEDLFGLI